MKLVTVRSSPQDGITLHWFDNGTEVLVLPLTARATLALIEDLTRGLRNSNFDLPVRRGVNDKDTPWKR